MEKPGNTARRGFRPRALGEIALRCRDPEGMAAFYEGVIGLERMEGRHSPGITFLRIGPGFGGHTAILALFRGASEGASTLHHIALSLPFGEQEAVMRWYEEIGQPFRVEHFG